MAKISDVLLTTMEQRVKPKGNLEPARKAAEAYKKLIENHSEVHGYYQRKSCIGRIDGDGLGPRNYMTFFGPMVKGINLDYSKPTKVYFEPNTLTVEQLDYFLRKEGLFVQCDPNGGLPIYEIWIL